MMVKYTITPVLLLVQIIYQNEAARILAVYPTPSISHQVVFRPLTNELVKRGHEVVVITTDPEYPKGQTPENLTEIDVHDLSYRIWNEKIVDFVNGDEARNLDKVITMVDSMIEISEYQFQIEEVQNIIKSQNNTFDLILTESWINTAFGFSHVLKAPMILFSSFGPFFDNMAVIGGGYNPVLYPQAPLTRVYNMSLWERFMQYYKHFLFTRDWFQSEQRMHEMKKRVFGADVPSLSELRNNVHMLFLNVHPIWDGNRPVPPGVVYVPGLHQNAEKALPKDLKSYLDSSEHGVIYISFGTNVNPSLLPKDKVQAIIQAVSKFPYDVLWKWNTDELPGRTKNIKISKWLPQSDLLKHPKIKLFIMQGGLQSTDEAITAGVPMIAIPMLGDQWYNGEKYMHHKIGLKVNLENVEAESLKKSIKTVIENKSYRKNVERLRGILHDQPMSSLERTVWWTEHVLRHGGARHLRAPAANMPWTQYYEIELVLIVLVSAFVALALACLLGFALVKIVLRKLFISYKLKNA